MTIDEPISSTAGEAFIEAINQQISTRMPSDTSTYDAEVTRVDSDGTTWVHIYGGADETPLRSVTSLVSVGDIIEVTISKNSARGGGSISSPSASAAYVDQAVNTVSDENAKMYAGIMNGLLQVDKALIKKASIEQLNAMEAVIQTELVDSLIANQAVIDKMRAVYALVDFANIDAAEIGAAKIHELFTESGFFENVRIEEGTVTGQLNSVLLDGDTARFSNIYADAIKLLGEDGLYHALNFAGMSTEKRPVYIPVTPSGNENPHAEGWYELSLNMTYVLTEDTTVSPSKSYFQTVRDVVVPSGDENPRRLGWEELVDGEYVPTVDITVDPDKTYYLLRTEYFDPATRSLVDSLPPGESLENGLHGSRIIAESITAREIDVSKLAAAILMSYFVQVGSNDSTHIEMKGDRLSFMVAGKHLEDYVLTNDTTVKAGKKYYSFDVVTNTYVEADTSASGFNPQANGLFEKNVLKPNVPEPGEVAYIAVDEYGESTFYMTKSVVVKDLSFGKWKWFNRANGNMSLKWVG